MVNLCRGGTPWPTLRWVPRTLEGLEINEAAARERLQFSN